MRYFLALGKSPSACHLVKFTALGGAVIGKKQCEKLRHSIMSLDSAKSVAELLELTVAH
jgi:hypothetical protein